MAKTNTDLVEKIMSGEVQVLSHRKAIHIIGGGTVEYVRPHLALSAPAYGAAAKFISQLCSGDGKMETFMHLTKMAGGHKMETNKDVEDLVDDLLADNSTKIIFMSAALVDFTGYMGFKYEQERVGGKYGKRVNSRATEDLTIHLKPTEKLIKKIRQKRKDIFLVGYKTTCGATEDEQYIAGLNLLKEASCNLVLANDTKTRLNMVITPEEARYHVTTDRWAALTGLVEMAMLRSHLTFTRSTVVAGESVPWTSPEVPPALRTVVDHCVGRGAYKPFRGATVGHFAAKIDDTTFLTSKRKTNFNDIEKLGLVKIKTDGPDTVLAFGAKPSVGGQSQRIVFKDHPDVDCIVHFHCPIKPDSKVPTVSQREFECGSHECGKNTSSGLAKFGNLYAVYLDQHGPNVVFNRSIDPQEVISFIEANFDLEGKTGGYVTIKKEPVTA